MKYDDDRYLDDEEDKDFWDDELELTSGEVATDSDYGSQSPYGPAAGYSPYGQDQPEYRQYGYPEETENGVQDGYGDVGRRNVNDEEENDYYDSDTDSENEEVPAGKSRVPRLDPEDPDYWISEENGSPLSGIMNVKTQKWKWLLATAAVLLVLLLGAWIWLFRPYADNAVKYGYLKNMERRGTIIKTFEGTMIPYKELGDPEPLYFRELPFSVESDSLAAVMKRMMLGCIPVRVEYEMYHSPLPWKGEERMIVIKADTADPRKILPPEYRH